MRIDLEKIKKSKPVALLLLLCGIIVATAGFKDSIISLMSTFWHKPNEVALPLTGYMMECGTTSSCIEFQVPKSGRVFMTGFARAGSWVRLASDPKLVIGATPDSMFEIDLGTSFGKYTTDILGDDIVINPDGAVVEFTCDDSPSFIYQSGEWERWKTFKTSKDKNGNKKFIYSIDVIKGEEHLNARLYMGSEMSIYCKGDYDSFYKYKNTCDSIFNSAVVVINESNRNCSTFKS